MLTIYCRLAGMQPDTRVEGHTKCTGFDAGAVHREGHNVR